MLRRSSWEWVWRWFNSLEFPRQWCSGVHWEHCNVLRIFGASTLWCRPAWQASVGGCRSRAAHRMRVAQSQVSVHSGSSVRARLPGWGRSEGVVELCPVWWPFVETRSLQTAGTGDATRGCLPPAGLLLKDEGNRVSAACQGCAATTAAQCAFPSHERAWRPSTHPV